MRAVLVFGFVLVASASAFVGISKSYHDETGIPEARRIKAYEDSLIANPQAGPASELEAERIVGGVVAPAHAHPYLGGLIISLINHSGNSVCGSTLVSPNRLVTAAHCWFDGVRQAWQFVVVLGSQFLFQDGTRIATRNVFMHPQYSPRTLFNDIAMIYLPFNAPLSNAIQPINLPNTWDWSDSFVGSVAVAAGYGRTSDQQVGVSINTVVSHVNLRVISNEECQRTYRDSIISSTLCTSGQGGVGVCGGDSGGPLVLNRWGRLILVLADAQLGLPLIAKCVPFHNDIGDEANTSISSYRAQIPGSGKIGVTSFAAQVNNVQVCQRGFPSGFARVTSFHSFITQHM